VDLGWALLYATPALDFISSPRSLFNRERHTDREPGLLTSHPGGDGFHGRMAWSWEVFNNVCILRIPSGNRCHTVSTAPSATNHPLFEKLTPSLAFCLRARCHGCRAKISWQYPLVKWQRRSSSGPSTGRYGIVGGPWLRTISLFLLIISVNDLYHQIIPDELSLPESCSVSLRRRCTTLCPFGDLWPAILSGRPFQPSLPLRTLDQAWDSVGVTSSPCHDGGVAGLSRPSYYHLVSSTRDPWSESLS